MPGLLEETRSVLHWLATGVSPDTYVNLMDQYRPGFEINRRVSGSEFRQALSCAEEAGLWRLDARRA
jgi:putative pyruvate formate lyase activating enzyme